MQAERVRKSSFSSALGLSPFLRVSIERTSPSVDTGQARPRYFDGRFLAARDLERDQTYIAARQAEQLRAAGPGVIHGLEVTPIDHATIRVRAGAALTATGRAVVVREDATLSFGDAATTERLNRELGLSSTPRELARRNTGVFVLLARPVEYTANPIGFYPASIEERRRPEDGEIVEAVAFTLVPYRDAAVNVEPARQRAALAHRLFVQRADAGLSLEAVPLAMLQLERGFVRWVDPWLVRREIGEAYDGMGTQRRPPRALVEAQLHQYRDHLAEIRSRHPEPFAASDELVALPPAGPYPFAALDLATQSDRFFPPTLPTALHVVPTDELRAALDEALAPPPIDLRASPSSLRATPVAVLLCLPRADVETLPPHLRRFPLRPASAVRASDSPMSVARLLELIETSGEPPAYFARLHRAIGDTEDGVLPIELQGVG
nr:MAG: hypothetical protein DIU78_08730 [Pseudomonadota bacterium]